MITHKGDLDYNTVTCLLEQVKNHIQNNVKKKFLQKKIYIIAVEVYENVYKHYNIEPCDITNYNEYEPIVEYRLIDNNVLINSKNLIYNNEAEVLEDKIGYLNSLSKEEHTEFFLKKIYEGEMSEQGDAGLGLIEVVKKSGHEIIFENTKLDSKLSYFSISVQIPIGNK